MRFQAGVLAGEVGKQFAPEATPPPVPATADIESVIRSTFDDLLRERHGVTGLVPIH